MRVTAPWSALVRYRCAAPCSASTTTVFGLVRVDEANEDPGEVLEALDSKQVEGSRRPQDDAADGRDGILAGGVESDEFTPPVPRVRQALDEAVGSSPSTMTAVQGALTPPRWRHHEKMTPSRNHHTSRHAWSYGQPSNAPWGDT
ncbi:hypothetical protein [Streptomyces sp. MMG1121]|uniref:hypothetical protein n=1 Tax=Streptomyces sp. MMG1121 TaxID=1415544 RepID=UPI00131AB364|nr:hypothetical protein [Streptomyces sp. MMG1121]